MTKEELIKERSFLYILLALYGLKISIIDYAPHLGATLLVLIIIMKLIYRQG